MTIKQIIDDKSVKRLEKRKLIVEGIVNGSLDFPQFLRPVHFCLRKTFPFYWKPLKKLAVPKRFPWERIT